MAFKAKVLVDFIAEFTYDITPNPKIEAREEHNQNDDITKWKLFVDGSSNQHGYGAKLVLQTLIE